MPKTVVFEGQSHVFPDDFTDDDISVALGSGSAPTVEKGYARRAMEAIPGGMEAAARMMVTVPAGLGAQAVGNIQGLLQGEGLEGATERGRMYSQGVQEVLPRATETSQEVEEMLGAGFEKLKETAGLGAEATIPGRIAEKVAPGFARTAGETFFDVAAFGAPVFGAMRRPPPKPPVPPKISVEQAEAFRKAAEEADKTELRAAKERASQPIEYEPVPKLRMEEPYEAEARIRPKEKLEVIEPEIPGIEERVQRIHEEREGIRPISEIAKERQLGLEQDRPPAPYWTFPEKTKAAEERRFETPYFPEKPGKRQLPEPISRLPEERPAPVREEPKPTTGAFGEPIEPVRLADVSPKQRGAIGGGFPKTEQGVRVWGAAYRNKETGEVVGPFNMHFEAREYLREKGWQFKDVESGFVTSEGRWVTRGEAEARAGASTSEGFVQGEQWTGRRVRNEHWMTGDTTPRTFTKDQALGIIPEHLSERLRQIMGKKERGALNIFGPKKQVPQRTEFEIFKDRLPDEYKGMAKRLWEQYKKNEEQKASASIEANPGEQTKVTNNLTGLNRYIPDLRTFDEIAPSLGEVKDIKGNWLHKLGTELFPGGKMYSQFKGNPVIKWIVDWVDTAQRNIERQVYKRLSSGETGFFPRFRSLSKGEQSAFWNVLIEHNGKKWLTPEELIRLGFNDKTIAVYEHYRQTVGQVLNDINIARAAKGMTPVEEVPGYFPARWKGKYFIEIRNPKTQQLMAVETSDRRVDLSKLREHLKNHGYEVSEITAKESDYINPKKAFQYRPLFDQVAETLGRDSFEKAAFDEIVAQYYEGRGFERRGFRRHFEPKAGVSGYMGRRAGVSQFENIKDGMQSLEAYTRDAYDFIENGKALTEISKFMQRPEGKHLENVKIWGEKYWDHALKNETAAAKVVRGFMEAIETNFPFYELPKGTLASSYRGLRKLMFVKMLGFFRPSFLATQLVQPIQMMLPALSEVRARTPGNYMYEPNAVFKGYGDWIAYKTGGKVDPIVTESLKWADDQGFIRSRMYDEILHATDLSKGTRIFDYVSGAKAMQWAEQNARTAAFLQAVRFLEPSGLTGKNLYEASANIMDQAMTNYRQHERAMFFERVGGEASHLMSPLTTFKINYIGQLAKFLKLAIENPKEFQNYRPLLAYTTTMLMFGGLTGLIALKEIDGLIELGKMAGLFDAEMDNATSFILKNTAKLEGSGRDLVRYGAISALTGANISPLLSMTQLIPHDMRSLMPIPSEALSTGTDVAKAILPGATSVERGQALAHLPGGPAAGLAEFAQTSPEGLLPDPRQQMAGKVRRDPNMPDPYRMMGTRSIQESEELQAAQQSRRQQQIIDQKRQETLSSAVNKYMDGQNIDKELSQFVELGGDPQSFAQSVLRALQNTKTTAYEREQMRIKSIRELRKWLEMQEYGVR